MTSHDHTHGYSHEPSAEELAKTGVGDIAQCPVMETTLIKSHAEEASLYRDYQGQRYWLCCDSCGPLFDADPERYATH